MRNILVLFILLGTLLVSCKRTNKDQVVEPESKAASSSFTVLDTLKANYFNGEAVSVEDSIAFQYIESIYNLVDNKLVRVKVNYYKRNVFCKVKFNEEVSWKLTFTKLALNSVGKYSKVEDFYKIITGTSSFLDSSNTYWDGKAPNKLFAKGDRILVELSFLKGSDLILMDTLYVSRGEYYPGNSAKLLMDFEDGPINTYFYNDNLDPGSETPFIDKMAKTPQGNSSVRIFGEDKNGDYFCGGMNIQKLDINTMKNFKPEEIYINMFIYGYPADNSLNISSKATKLNIGVSENDLTSNDEVGKVVFDGALEDTFEKQIAVDWVGWKFISVKYSDLLRSNSKKAGGNGNGKHEPDKAFSVNCNLISSPNGSIVGANVDYIIMTYGQPFDANNL